MILQFVKNKTVLEWKVNAPTTYGSDYSSSCYTGSPDIVCGCTYRGAPWWSFPQVTQVVQTLCVVVKCNRKDVFDLFQFVLLSGMLLQHKRDALLIVPTSYVCLTHWYDAMCGQRGVTIDTAVARYHAFKEKVHVLTVSKKLSSTSNIITKPVKWRRMWNNRFVVGVLQWVFFQGRLRTLVQLLTGFYRSIYGASRFNMLVDVFCETGVQSGEAERVLVNTLLFTQE